MFQPRRSPISVSLGFSLVELLVVVAVIAIVIGFTVPALESLGRASALSTAGNKVASLASQARQRAVSRGTLTALVVLTHQGGDDDYRALTVLEYDTLTGWQQFGPWETLPAGIVVEPRDRQACSFLINSPDPFPLLANGPPQENPPVTYHGAKIPSPDGYAARVFLPNGGLQNPDKPAQLRLIEGFIQNGEPVYTRPNDQAGDQKSPANYYDIALIGATGALKIKRPE